MLLATRYSPLAIRHLRDDVGRELVFNEGNSIPQHELALLEPLYLEDIGRGRPLQRLDRRVEVAMLLAQPGKLRPQIGFFLLGHPCRSVRATLSCACASGQSKRGQTQAPQQHTCNSIKDIGGFIALHNRPIHRLTAGFVAHYIK